MRPAYLLLAKLVGVKATGKGRWMACCPAHADASPSLSLREMEDGRLLIHDFGGCEAHEVLAAVGMSVGELFADRIGHFLPPIRAGFTADELLISIQHETSVALEIIEAAQESYLTLEALRRLRSAVSRIGKARSLAYRR
jgi:hypothetical protein